jgi:DNA primase
MRFFESYYSEYDFSGTETAVCCPFPHHTSSGFEYSETNPSAHINSDKSVIHCKVCDKGYSEQQFIAKLFGCSYSDAGKVLFMFDKAIPKSHWQNTELTDKIKQLCISLGISEQVIEELDIKTTVGDDIAFPVIMYNQVIDVRQYRPHDKANKMRGKYGTTTGMIIPFDIWKDSDKSKWTILCAGEKDMAVTRSNGFNAITLTGGEKALPKYVNAFKDRKIAICYDHDETGIAGANRLGAYLLLHGAAEVKVVTNFHEVCCEHGEDLTDFFTKYNKTKLDLAKYIKETESLTEEQAQQTVEAEELENAPLVSLIEASNPRYVGKVVQSNIQVIANFDAAMPIPNCLTATKVNLGPSKTGNTINVGTQMTWELNETNCQDILKLMDGTLTETQISANIREILHIPKSEQEISVSKQGKETIYKCNVTDLFESRTKDLQTLELQAYVIGKKLESGRKYLVKYKAVPHPYKGQALVMIILDAKDATDSISNFKITQSVKDQLDLFRNIEGDVPKKLNKLIEMVKGYIGYDGYNNLIAAIDLSYHTALEFNVDRFTNIRGYLDTLVVTESRVGKSTTAQALQNLYGLGTFTSLAGNSATVAGLVGGSNKVSSGFQTRAGLIPMNHRGLVIFEELAKCDGNIIKELTDIRSSNKVRIARVSGTTELPALVRMITLTNVKSIENKTKPIKSYPSGIDILEELIGAPEDIARYDLILILGEQGTKAIDPNWVPAEPFEQSVYQTRIRWIWSRTADQIKIDRDTYIHTVTQCNELNKKYNSHIKLFGTEAWKKVLRLATAIAGYLVSTDSTYENIIVTKEHVDAAISFLVSCYDNPTFKLKEYVDIERRYSEIDDEGVDILQDLYIKNCSLLIQLERCTKTTKQNLMSAAGLDTDTYNKLMQVLVRSYMVTISSYNIEPTQRFRKGMCKINRDVNIHKIGEHDA